MRALKAVPENCWTAEDFESIRGRAEDNWELRDALVGISALAGDDDREVLLEALRRGQTRMLSNVSDVGSIPKDVVKQQVATLSESVRREVEEARGGTFYRHDGRNLAMLNIWHADGANWLPVYELLNEFRVMPRSLIDLAALLRDASDQIPSAVRDELLQRLEHVRDRTPIDFGEWLESRDHLGTIIREAIDAVAPGAVSDAELWDLIGGSSDQRSAAARIVGRRRDVSRLDILACLSHDKASTVRAWAAHTGSPDGSIMT